MKTRPLALLALLLLLPLLGPRPARAADAIPTVHHDLKVQVDPAEHRIRVTDRLRVPQGAWTPSNFAGLRLTLSRSLTLRSRAEAWTVSGPEAGPGGRTDLATWWVRPANGHWPRGDLEIPLGYQGTIHRPPEQHGAEYARSFATTPGTISPEGVVLTGATGWIPHPGGMLTFRLTTVLPDGWDVVSQGRRTRRSGLEDGRRLVVWECPHPMEEVYLIANRFTEYTADAGTFEAQAFLRSPDEALASKFLEATQQYVEMYRGLIGPYPFAKFALVENFWETGYGMPSFTLLGPKVIRFPFILHSSYPHEILHNWWGNSVYVDWKTGNWCEGMTAYLADHLIKEGRGLGHVYRRDTLKGFRSYVSEGRDFPLVEFTSRRSAATQAVGYGKALMVVHMLRRRLGDDRFKEAVRTFYRRHRWEAASWADIRKAFEDVSGEDLEAFFTQWTTRKGAPSFAVAVEKGPTGGLGVTLRQTQQAEPFHTHVPVAVTFAAGGEALWQVVEMTGREARLEIQASEPVLRVDVDPLFDVFRRLDEAETPPTLSEVFGAEKVLIVLPKGEDWGPVAAAWGRHGDVAVVGEGAIEALPADRAVWLLGRKNRFAEEARKRMPDHPGDSDVCVIRREGLPPVGWIATDVPRAMAGLARKLPHYGKYSWLGFRGPEPTNVAKGEWPTVGSPLTVVLTDGEVPERGTLAKREPLARLAPLFSADAMKKHVDALCAPAMEGRGVGTKGLERATRYVADAFRRIGLEPAGDDGTWFQSFEANDGPNGAPVRLRNVVARIPGAQAAFAAKPVILGAHVDHLGLGWPEVRQGQEGKLHPGADDNASGVAVLIEAARVLAAGPKPARPIRLVAFTGEEWGRKGSKHFVAATKDAIQPLAMVNLDSVGRLSTSKLMVLGSGSAKEWVHVARGIGFTTGVESVCVKEDLDASDQASFEEAGVPAIQLFTGAHADYHRPSDTPDKVDLDGLVKVATWVREAATYLANRPEPLTAPDAKPAAHPGRPGGRKTSLGTLPDFRHPGPGVLVDDVLEDSPAAKAGIRKGDLVIAIDGREVKDLRGYAMLLASHAPGDRIRIGLRRGEEEIEVEAVLVAR